MSSDLGRRIGFTLGGLLVFRLGTFIPIPGVDPAVWQQLFRQQAGSPLDMANWMSGGALGRLSVFALGILPFLTAALLLQLVSLVSRSLRALPKQGERGRRKLDVYTVGLTIILATFQSLGVVVGLEAAGNLVAEPGLVFRLTTVLTLTGGVIFLVWLAGQITARGIGNGLALMLAIGIVAELPAYIAGVLDLGRRGALSTNLILVAILILVALTALIVHLELARRQLLVTFSRRQIGIRMIEGQSYLQLKLNGAGIVPTILASWLLLLLTSVVNWGWELPNWIVSQFAHGRPLFLIAAAIAIMLCVFFYSALLLDPDEMAEDLKRHGGVIAGVEPGQATANHIDHVISRVSTLGAIYLAFVYLIPEILIANWSVPFYLGGTSLLIVVCAILDCKAQVERALQTRLEAG